MLRKLRISRPRPPKMTSYDHEYFSRFHSSIDFSPYQPAAVVTMVLDEKELRIATYSQYERFWRVWYKERTFYASALQTLILGLRGPPERTCDDGISRFLAYFETDVKYRYPELGLEIYVLSAAKAPEQILKFSSERTPQSPHT